MSQPAAASFTFDQITLGANPFPQARPTLLIALNSGPGVIPADAAHSSIALLTQCGIGTVWM
jgi:hypothetical protein